MRATIVWLTAAVVYSAYYLACLLLSPDENSVVKGIAGLFLFAMGLFALREKKIRAKHVALSAVIATSVGLFVPLLYILVVINLHNFNGYTLFKVPLLLFAP